MKRSLKIIAKIVGVIFLTVILFVVVFAAAFFIVPEIEIKEPRLQKLAQKFAPADLKIKWDTATFKILKSGALSKDVLIEFTGICVRYKGKGVDACFDRVFWGTSFSISNFHPRLTRFVPLIVTGGKIQGNLDLLKSDKPKPETKGGFDVVNFVRTTLLPKWQWNGSIVELQDVNLKTGGQRLQGALLLETQGSWDQSPLAKRADQLNVSVYSRDIDEQYLRLSLINFNIPGKLRTSAQMHVVLPRESEDRVWRVFLNGDTQLADGKRVLINSKNKIYDWQTADFNIDAILKNVSYVREAQLRGNYKKNKIDGLFSAKMGGFKSQVKTLDFVDCHYDLELNEKLANIRCGPQTVTLAFVENQKLNKASFFRMYPTFDLKISNFSYQRGIEADYDVKLALRHMNLMNVDLDAFGSIASLSKTESEPAELHYSTDAELKVAIDEFQKLVNLLRNTPLALPAPINQMNGSLTAMASGRIDESGGVVPFRFQTKLGSAEQDFNTTLGGEFSLSKNDFGKLKPALRLNLALDNVRLAIPRIDVTTPPPKLTPDSRFKRGLSADRPPTEIKKGTPIEIDATIATSSPGALKLATNVTGAPIPITLTYSIRPLKPGTHLGNIRPARAAAANVGEEPPTTETSGHILVSKTPIDLKGTNVALLNKIQRDAYIDYIDLTIEPDGTQKIKGRLLVKNPDAEIRVLILGTVDQPVVHLESDPPADENQILAALLFGRPLDQIDEGQTAQAAQTKTALNDTALTLVQMLFLSSTPIDSLNYDAESGRVVASVGLGGGTSLELGGGAASAGTEVGLRRRIAKNVYFNTYVENSGQSEQRLVSAFVEWVRRF
jgi:hypothetical protein